MRRLVLALALIASGLVAGCGGAGAPAGTADITGQITRATDESGRRVVLVEENPADTSGSAKAAVTVDSGTRVLRRTDTGDVAATSSDLRTGLRVSVWFDGPVAMSYPLPGEGRDAAHPRIPLTRN